MRAWPLVLSWIAKNFEAAILKRLFKQRMRGLLFKSWAIWVIEADLPPGLHTPSDSD